MADWIHPILSFLKDLNRSPETDSFHQIWQRNRQIWEYEKEKLEKMREESLKTFSEKSSRFFQYLSYF